MAKIRCEMCQKMFEGRPNRRYCSIRCRRKAEQKQRKIKKEEHRQEMLANMPPEERAFYDSCREWEENIPTAEELWPELDNVWDNLPPTDWDIPEVTW